MIPSLLKTVVCTAQNASLKNTQNNKIEAIRQPLLYGPDGTGNRYERITNVIRMKYGRDTLLLLLHLQKKQPPL